nr:hypothetical protein [Tanacetum cinerariifolium]
RVFDFSIDEPEPHPAYHFFAPGLLPGYAGNLKNNNGWIKADVPLHRKLGVVADELMVGLIVDEIVEPIVEAEEQYQFNEKDEIRVTAGDLKLLLSGFLLLL